jgi:hypothetical protein
MPKYGKFRTRILAQEERRRSAPVGANITEDIKPIAKRNMGVKFIPKTGPNAGEEVMFRMPPFPKNLSAKQEEKLNPAHKAAIKATFKRYKEDEATGMLRMEELKPLNKMGTVPLQRNEMPMAYKHKVYKPTAKAKAIPFTNRNAL